MLSGSFLRDFMLTVYSSSYLFRNGLLVSSEEMSVTCELSQLGLISMFRFIGRRIGFMPIDFLSIGPDYLYFCRTSWAVLETLPNYPLDNSYISSLLYAPSTKVDTLLIFLSR